MCRLIYLFDSCAVTSTILKILKVSRKLRALFKAAQLVTEPRLMFRLAAVTTYSLPKS